MPETKQDSVTLSALLALFQEQDRAFILRRIGPHECEAVTGGTVREIRSTRCMEVCGGSVVESVSLDLNGWPETWPDAAAPVLVVIIINRCGDSLKDLAP